MYNTTTTNEVQTLNFTDTFIVIDKNQGFVSVHEGQQLGLDSDWGGRMVAFLPLQMAEAIANALYQPWSDPSLNDVRPAEDRDDWIGA